jgi:5-methylcytosine-specific restriction endonuclease McrA
MSWADEFDVDGNRLPPRLGYRLRKLWPVLSGRWGRVCVYCGEATLRRLVVEHITPKSRGGTNALWNLTIGCRCCNRKKAGMNAEEFGHAWVQRASKDFRLREAEAKVDAALDQYMSLRS